MTRMEVRPDEARLMGRFDDGPVGTMSATERGETESLHLKVRDNPANETKQYQFDITTHKQLKSSKRLFPNSNTTQQQTNPPTLTITNQHTKLKMQFPTSRTALLAALLGSAATLTLAAPTAARPPAPSAVVPACPGTITNTGNADIGNNQNNEGNDGVKVVIQLETESTTTFIQRTAIVGTDLVLNRDLFSAEIVIVDVNVECQAYDAAGKKVGEKLVKGKKTELGNGKKGNERTSGKVGAIKCKLV
ncbi:hypothetical protein B0H66DRAFT_274211 [Apodospora peruviana]|uniref:Uncharacterized protein n=1 Tax=Apodospora peruviana TaxID=516989 RepID=A0AAE0M1T3_9PEZI|nr:hypothetical protein B0H66DRAFT_274211 [Apodospora peruviana]